VLRALLLAGIVSAPISSAALFVPGRLRQAGDRVVAGHPTVRVRARWHRRAGSDHCRGAVRGPVIPNGYHALRELTDPRAELIGVVDSDYQILPRFLTRCAPLFADPNVGFIQAPQDHRHCSRRGTTGGCTADPEDRRDHRLVAVHPRQLGRDLLRVARRPRLRRSTGPCGRIQWTAAGRPARLPHPGPGSGTGQQPRREAHLAAGGPAAAAAHRVATGPDVRPRRRRRRAHHGATRRGRLGAGAAAPAQPAAGATTAAVRPDGATSTDNLGRTDAVADADADGHDRQHHCLPVDHADSVGNHQPHSDTDPCTGHQYASGHQRSRDQQRSCHQRAGDRHSMRSSRSGSAGAQPELSRRTGSVTSVAACPCSPRLISNAAERGDAAFLAEARGPRRVQYRDLVVH
jgi:hypothetical protein